MLPRYEKLNCAHNNLHFTGREYEFGKVSLNEQGEASFHCQDCDSYMVACLSCSGMDYDSSEDEIFIRGDVSEHHYVWCRFIGVHVLEWDKEKIRGGLRSYKDYHSDTDKDFNHHHMNHYLGDQNLYAIPRNVISDEMFVTGSDGGNPLWWQCDHCKSVFITTDL